MFIEVTERETNSPTSMNIEHIITFAPRCGGGTNVELVGGDDWFVVVEDYETVKAMIQKAAMPFV
ncbi:hypothetical protein [Paracoccus rhizosphaerae]|uniref:Uncharacterized protein n=1 Tax=Paracoccus rhizosphaerae TaxID=1133347 RepID=A0ABV6CEV8_9RHOB|nr:hypothetical protein [Paracoccus rhizosphaerae]